MVQRGFLERSRTGRRAWFTMTERLEALLEEGGGRLLAPPVRDLDPDTWTLLSFSIPEDQRDDRHSLRSALGWNGFGPLRNGLWIAPGEVDVTEIVSLLDLDENVEVFVARARPPTDVREIVRQAWDLDAIAAGYRSFLARWTGDGVAGLTPLAEQVRLLTEWRQLLVDDPQLSAQHLPGDWPSTAAFALYSERLTAAQAAAEQELAEILELRPDV